MKKILVVDDDPELLDLVATVLVSAGYVTKTVLDWENVYGAVTAFQPDLILMDVQLDGVDGRILCKNLKNSSETGQITVLICSALQDIGDTVHAYGAEGFLAKPFTARHLLAFVARYLAR